VGVRLDGATRGDRAEAIALVVGGVALVAMPIVALFDRIDGAWLFLSSAAAVAGLLIGGLGARWFLVPGPTLAASPFQLSKTQQAPELPVQVRLVDARYRLIAHVLRYLAFGGGFILLLLGSSFLPSSLRIAVLVSLFVTSVIADQLLLRPRRYILDQDGLQPRGIIAKHGVRWEEVQTLYWRSYPDDQQPPYPSGERIIIEREDDSDMEFVFHRKHKGTEAEFVVRATQELLTHRLRVLTPRPQSTEVGEHEEAPSESNTDSSTTPSAG